MPAVSVFVDSKLQACVGTDGLHVLTVSIGGAKTDDSLATIEFAGGNYPQEGESTYLTWLSELEVAAGQNIRVTRSGPRNLDPRLSEISMDSGRALQRRLFEVHRIGGTPVKPSVTTPGIVKTKVFVQSGA